MSGTVVGPIGTLGNIDTLVVGGREFTNLSSTTFVLLSGSTIAGGSYATLRLGSASSGYVVPTGKTLTIWAVSFFGTGTSESTLGYASSDVGFNSVSAPSSPVYLYGANTAAFTGPASNTIYQAPAFFQVPAGSYPFVSVQVSNASMTVYGYVA